MTGKNHVITNICTVTSTICGVAALHTHAYYTTKTTFFQSVIVGLDGILWPCIHTMFLDTGGLPFPVFAVISMAAFFIGSIMPDIDSENSMLGKFLHLPIEHRTWTHAVWVPIVLGLLSILHRCMSWLTLGYLLHLVWDNLSKGGVCFFYPISKYRYFGNSGAKIKDGHFLYLYRTGQPSEGIVVGALATVTVVCVTLAVVFGAFRAFLV